MTDATDPERYRAFADQALAAGYDVRELGPRDAAAAHRLYAANRPDFPSTPSTEPDRYTEEEFTGLIGAGRAFGAWNADRLCALTVMRQQGPDRAGTEIIVTDRAERGRGLATAVKAYAIRTLWQEGVRHFGTGGAEVNEASLKANLRLGYEIEPLWLTYGRVARTPARSGHPTCA
ncbi:GNAT family N-acetyltransferase [Actinopolymorpha cephalotaxi]|uniref:GNAT superfamily N-acetyltransferase n=1 Tax=Actinopolymorpha cephalotaxi TaxID=504797 RepID=A0ABX2SCG9_9ACTN|nr:GNAT family N-acetyltransferase [Actinopolymorpha cephalotaxi]NYH87351.1 GNAT superfamily N-acetyltransferase [Actinopolymorpha cephalotaxi]